MRNERLFASALAADQRFRLPLALRIANGARDLSARWVAFGVRRVRVENVRSGRGLLPAAAKTRSR